MLSSIEEVFKTQAEVSKVDKPELISLLNKQCKENNRQYWHLKGVKIYDLDSKACFAVHVILEAGYKQTQKNVSLERLENLLNLLQGLHDLKGQL